MKIEFRYFRIIGAACSVLALAACEPQQVVEQTATATVPVARTGPVEVDVTTPRPDLFSKRALAGWDGRPSLGGAWIAHPDVGSAERARITEIATGRSITAALFRRDASIPGPPFQLSAEAATQLGVEPGVAVEVEVVAVRIERSIVEAPAPVVETVADAQENAAPVAEDTPAIETAELPPSDALPEQMSEPLPEPPSEPEAEQPAPPQVPVEPASVASAPVLDAAPATQPAASDTSVQASAAPERPFMQVGTFGVAANATTLVERLQAAGLNARAVPAGALTRVLVGPAQSTAEQARMRDTLREMGFTDALAVSL